MLEIATCYLMLVAARRRQSTNQRGFTLIELLVTIAIVAVLSAVGLATYSQAQLLARDSRRKQDLRSIALALEIYRQKNGHYPCWANNSDFQSSTSDRANFWISDKVAGGTGCGINGADATLDQSYINSMPNDPLKNDGSVFSSSSNHGYTYWATTCYTVPAGQYYFLTTRLENRNDADRIEKTGQKWCAGLGPVFYGPGGGLNASFTPDMFIVSSD